MEDVHHWLSSMVANKDQSDVEFHVEAVQDHHTFVIPAHSLILRRASRVFYTMLEPGKFKEGATGVAEIKVYGNKADAVCFIKYLYTNKLPTLDLKAYIALMQTANLYEMTKLFETCEKRVHASLTPFSVCDIYTLFGDISSETFRNYCEAMMLKFSFLIFFEKLHISLSEETMILLLSSEKLNVLDEEQVLRATWDWGHSKCILENVAGTKEPKEMITSLLPLIKWSEISPVETRSPWFDLCTYYKKTTTSSGITIERKVENTTSLSCFANVLDIYQNVDCANSSLNYESFTDKQTVIYFTCNHTVLLTGFKVRVGIASIVYETLPFYIYVNTLKIENESFKTTLPDRKMNANGREYHYYTFTIDFCKPVVLRTNVIHGINLQQRQFNLEAQRFNLYSKALLPGILGSDNEVNFCISGQIAAIQKLFYFRHD